MSSLVINVSECQLDCSVKFLSKGLLAIGELILIFVTVISFLFNSNVLSTQNAVILFYPLFYYVSGIFRWDSIRFDVFTNFTQTLGNSMSDATWLLLIQVVVSTLRLLAVFFAYRIYSRSEHQDYWPIGSRRLVDEDTMRGYFPVFLYLWISSWIQNKFNFIHFY